MRAMALRDKLMGTGHGPVVALEGRRVDSPEAANRRFPPENVGLVRERLLSFLEDRGATTLVCSAACGANLVALEAAGTLGLRRRVVLPFAPERFRETSVIDRPGEWGPLYDRVIEAVTRAGDLVVLEGAGEGGAAYTAAEERILDEALRLTGLGAVRDSKTTDVPSEKALAVIVWEGQSRGYDDATEQFAASARTRGLAVQEILTR
jgi:hypothetical protein